MRTRHTVYFENARDMGVLDSESVDLVVTSPPYPMIEMWDGTFSELNPAVGEALAAGRGGKAFELMHGELDGVWKEVARVIRPGGMVCINIGDAVRTLDGIFSLYANHSRIQTRLLEIGLSALPAIIWRKQTNAPNKFMGSGMLPPGAYVTLEHEYILIFRKGDKMAFPSEAGRESRRESAYFWEERNAWFSDVWFDLKGTGQNSKHRDVRARSAAFPFELPFRLIHMFSLSGGLVLDPFLGTGTTMLAAMAAGRDSVGFERDGFFRGVIAQGAEGIVSRARERLMQRLTGHREFVRSREENGYAFKHANQRYGFPVMTAQEKRMRLWVLSGVTRKGDSVFEGVYQEAGSVDPEEPPTKSLPLFDSTPVD